MHSSSARLATVGVTLLVLLSLLAAAAGCGGGQSGFAVSDVITTSYPFGEPRYPLADLSHRDHSIVYKNPDGQRIRCVACHHQWDASSAMPPRLCWECHTEYGDDILVPPLIHAYHIRCTECHRANEMIGRPAGPITDCYACHKQ